MTPSSAQPRSTWHKSSFSGNGPGNECLEVAAEDGGIRLRESDDERIVVTLARTTLAAMLSHVKSAGPTA